MIGGMVESQGRTRWWRRRTSATSGMRRSCGRDGFHPLDGAQLAALKRCAHASLDRGAIYTLPLRPVPRMSEIRGLKARHVDAAVGVVRFGNGFTTRGLHSGNNGCPSPIGADSDNVRSARWPSCKGRPVEAPVFEHETKPAEPICGASLYRRFRNAAKRRASHPPVPPLAPLVRHACRP